MKIFSCCFCLFILMTGCTSPQLEREDVPLIWGIRYEGHDAAEWIPRNLDYGADHWMIEIPMVADSLHLPRIPDLPLAVLGEAIEEAQIQYSIAFTTLSGPELFPNEKPINPDQWFPQLEAEILSFLNHFKLGPERIVVGNDWKETESYDTDWRQLFTAVKKESQAQVGYGWRGDRKEMPDWLDACDFFALEYPPLAESDPRPYAVQNNPKMGRCADSLGIPLFIYRGNLMGKDRVPGLKNRLRFWPTSLHVQGFVANSMYPKLPPLDSSSYFGVMTDTAFLNYWNQYQNAF